jgi:Mn2+/Fe2+ NRAMP family transporter
VLGTTISPYLFFWQASQEVEEKTTIAHAQNDEGKYKVKVILRERAFDVGLGTFFSNAVMFFIILVVALTLHAHGITEITSSLQAAEALQPLAGDKAMILYTVGIIGLGLLAIPTLAGSSAYAFADLVKQWRGSLDLPFKKAQAFYGIILFSIFAGMMMNLLQINPFKALYWSAILNGLIAPFMLVAILLIARDPKIMKNNPAPLLNQLIVGIATAGMFAAGLAMFIL